MNACLQAELHLFDWARAAGLVVAAARWSKAAPVTSHPYLRKKGVEAHGLREDRHGNLLVPMRDAEGRLWGLQSISQDGDRKLYQKVRRAFQ